MSDLTQRFIDRQLPCGWPPRNWWIKFITVTAFLVICGWLFAMRFSIGVNPQAVGCIRGSLFVIDHLDRMPRRGRVFAYRAMQAEPIYANGTLMAKVLVAGPGDTVEVTPDFRVLVNDKTFARGLPHLKFTDEITVRKFIGKRVLKGDQYWMLGTLPMSFDSRYWGPIHADHIVGRAYVLF